MMNNIRKGEFLDISPKNDPPLIFSHNDKENAVSVAVLSLVHFSRAPYVSFGTVRLGTSRSEVLCIENPVDNATEIKVDKVASTKGFSVDRTQFIIPAEGSTHLMVNWTPVEEGNVRELITFIANGITKHQAILLGRAEAPKKKKKSLWDSIKRRKAAHVSVPFRENKTHSSLKKTANKTFHVSRQPQYKTERVQSPLRSCNEEPLIQERVSVLTGSIENVQEQLLLANNYSPVPFEKTHVTLTQTGFESIVSSCENSPVVLLVPTAELFDERDVTKRPCAAGATCITDDTNMTGVLNTTHFPVCTPKHGDSRPITRIHSHQSPISCEGKIVSSTAKKILPALSVRDALSIIQSDLTESDGESPPNACSSFDFSDSLESVKENDDQNPVTPEVTERRVQDISFELETLKPRLTFFVKPKSDQVNGSESEVNDVVPLNFRKFPFSPSTVTKSRVCPTGERSRTTRKMGTSKRQLLEKTLELSEDSPAKSSLLGQKHVCLPVIDSDASHDIYHSAHSPLEAVPSDHSPVRWATTDYFPVSFPPRLAQLDMSSVIATPSCGSQTSVKSDLKVLLNVQHQSTVTFLMPQPNETPVDVPALSLSCGKKRKSDEFLSDKMEKGKPLQVKRSRVFPAAKETKKPIQDRKFSSRSTSQSLHRKAVATKAVKSVGEARTKLPISKSVQKSMKSFGSSSLKTARNVAVAQAKLTFIKPAQSVIPRHPLPFAAKNMFYDERWIEKQERGFVWWINYVLTPDDFKVSTEVTKVSAVSLAMGSDNNVMCPKAPTKEEMSFKMYTARRRLNSLRRAACQLFTSEAMVKAIQRLELEVEAKRLLVRKDRHLWKDIGERQKILTWLLSYNPLWLRIGLETIFGELIPLENNSDVMGLAVFILNRLLWNPDIAAEFRHPTVPHLYRDGHKEALSCFTLKKLLLLVCFLDKAKESRLIEHDPCLFCMDAEFKTSKDLLLAFSRDFLSGEGILSRHLGHLGLPVSHAQVPLDEFNFAVKNLASDLRCGIRLVRVMELFTQDWSLSCKLRMPAVSRLQKVHNVELALEVLKAKGVDLKDEYACAIDARDIVDGHREKTLTLLWKIIFAFQVDVLLDDEQLKEEISFLKRTWRTRQKLETLRANLDVADKPNEERPPFQHSSTKIKLLMDWVNAVSAFYDSNVENFTVSFSDGQILCFLIHHYHPSHLPLESVCRRTTQTVDCGQEGRLGLNCSSSDSDSSFDIRPRHQTSKWHIPKIPFSEHDTEASVNFAELLENEKSNFQLVNKAVAYLGGVPAMVHTADMSNTIPNEKVVMCYLSFLCARLLDLRKETRSARIIQGAWRKYRLRIELRRYKEANAAATTIQSVIKKFLQRRRRERLNAAAIVIQTVWRSYSACLELRRLRMEKLKTLQDSAATAIQAQWRKHLAMRKFQKLKHCTVMMQARLRMIIAVTAYRRILWAARTIQEHRCAVQLAKEERERYLSLRCSVITIQRSYRKWKARTWVKKTYAATVIQRAFQKWQERKLAQQTVAAIKIQHSSAIVIQRAFRAHILRRRFTEMRQAANVIQRWFRAWRQKENEMQQYLEMKRVTITLQAAFRGYLVRKAIKKQWRASVVIQTAFRMFVARKRFLSLKKATLAVQQQYKAVLLGQKLRKEYLDRRSTVVILQALWRGRAERRKIEKMCKAAVLIQSYYRSYAARSDLRLKRNAVLTIQSYYRAHRLGRMTRLRYLLLRKAAISLQAGFHGMKVRQELKKQHRAATLIQATFRAFTCRQQFLSLRSAATVLQKRYRAHLLSLSHQRHYSLLRQMTIRIQAVYRGSRERRNIRSMHKAATTIQRRFRTSRDRKRFISLRAGAVLVQQRYRALIAMRTQRKEYLVKCWSAINLQAAYRGMKVRQHLKQMQAAACVIQRRFRTNTARRQYLSLKSSVLTIQRRYRCVTAARRQREHYHCVRSATITLQAAYRGQKTRKEMQQKHAAATVLQAEFRMHRAVVTFQAMRLAAVIIQRHYKACKQMKQDHEKFLTIRNSAITIQAAFRGQRARQNMVQQHRAAIIIQSNYRMHRQQVAFQRMHWAATVLQQKFRALKLRDSQVLLYQQIKKATVCIQTLFRYKRAREQEKQKKAAVKVQSFMRMCVQRRRFLQQKAASIVIQSAFRCHHARVRYTKMQTSSMQIQRWYKSCRLAQKQKVEYLAVRRATVTLQSAFRGMLARRLFAQHQAAVKIQSVLKMFRYRKRFLNLRSSAVKIQVHYRMWAARRLFRCYRTAALTLQKNFRAWQEMKDQRCVYLNTRKSALTLQAAVRGHIEYKKFQRIKRSAVTIQAAFRGHRARLHAKKVQAALKIQAWFRGNLVRQKFIAKQKAIATVRRCMQTRLHRNRFQKIRQSVCVIQRRWRETLDAKRAHKNFLKMRYSAVKIQALWRGRRIRLNQQKEWKAACMIQSSYRGYMQRKAFAHMKKSVLVLQRRFRALQRGKEGLETFENMKTAVTTLQAFCRGWHARRLLKEEAQSRRICRFSAAVYVNLCAIKIQRGLRAHWALKSAKRQLHYVIYIQRWIRAKLQKKRYLDKKLKIIKVQRAVRGWYSWRNRAATIIQHAVRKYLSKKRDQRVQLGIIKAQALWRGHRSREANDSPKVVAMRHRLRKINQTVKAEDRLCNKTTVAIDYLLRYKHFSYILAALKHLETATRLSPECCELLVNSGATLIIFTLIRSCNRSIPCMEVITFAIQVLLNLSKYYKTTDAVYAVENSVNTLLDLLQIYREKAGDKVADKGGSIFTKTCFLLIILLQDEQRALEVRNLPKATDRIRSLYFLTARKHKMDTESSVKKLKINASLNGSFFPQRTPRKEKPQRRIAPDWALRQDNMKELVDPLQAIQMVAEAFTVLP